MWKPNQPGTPNPQTPEPQRPSAPVSSFETSASAPTPARPAAPAGSPAGAVPAGEQATIGKSLIVKGEVSGSESLYIDGKVEGAINLPGNRVTVGRNGQVAANIMAREIVVLGKVRGNCLASDRVDIRSEGSLTGDVIAARISIEDGAFFKGGIDIRKPGTG
ncbi:MAG: bactofilin family protein, partial [Janthinobacterium lividum]